jgi:1-acyl-sn-glycerol-3-phosphate acyltransferase
MIARVFDWVRFHLVLAAFGVLCLGWSLPAACFYWLVPRHRRPPVGQYAIMSGFRMYLALMRLAGLARFDLQALDGLADQGAMVIAPNHRSLLDAVLVISRLPRVVCITKASLWDNVFLGGGIRMAAYIRNDVPVRLIRAAVAALRGGQQLLIFPEGTRAAADRMESFKPGFALMAKAARVPVQTVFLRSNSGYLQKGWGLFRQPDFPLIYSARLGRRFDVTGDLGVFVAELEQYFQSELFGLPPETS